MRSLAIASAQLMLHSVDALKADSFSFEQALAAAAAANSPKGVDGDVTTASGSSGGTRKENWQDFKKGIQPPAIQIPKIETPRDVASEDQQLVAVDEDTSDPFEGMDFENLPMWGGQAVAKSSNTQGDPLSHVKAFLNAKELLRGDKRRGIMNFEDKRTAPVVRPTPEPLNPELLKLHLDAYRQAFEEGQDNKRKLQRAGYFVTKWEIRNPPLQPGEYVDFLAADGDLEIKEGVVQKIEGPSVWVKFSGKADTPARRVPQSSVRRRDEQIELKDDWSGYSYDDSAENSPKDFKTWKSRRLSSRGSAEAVDDSSDTTSPAENLERTMSAMAPPLPPSPLQEATLAGATDEVLEAAKTTPLPSSSQDQQQDGQG